MQDFPKRAVPEWLLIIVASKLAATAVLLGLGFG
jgi:hypothetical protein